MAHYFIVFVYATCAMANVILDTSIRGINILNTTGLPLNQSAGNDVATRAIPFRRGNLGQVTCGNAGQNRGRTIVQQYKLHRATCQDDINYLVECQEYIPNTRVGLDIHEQCGVNEVCAEVIYHTVWGESSSDVFCEEKVPEDEETWSTSSSEDINTSICGGGLTSIKEEGEYAAISLQFYGGSNRASRQRAGQSWLQSNKRGYLKTVNEGNGLWWQGRLEDTETIQPCFSRSSSSDALFGVMDWVNIDNSIGILPREE
ncbi:hypothetical protein EsH8_I_001391 [Colletotrichum jinshuiense]